MRGKDREWQESIVGRLGLMEIKYYDRVLPLEREVLRLKAYVDFQIQLDNERRAKEAKEQTDRRRRERLAEAGLRPKDVEAAMRVFYGEAGDGR